jgi:hypothetical protein
MSISDRGDPWLPPASDLSNSPGEEGEIGDEDKAHRPSGSSGLTVELGAPSNLDPALPGWRQRHIGPIVPCREPAEDAVGKVPGRIEFHNFFAGANRPDAINADGADAVSFGRALSLKVSVGGWTPVFPPGGIGITSQTAAGEDGLTDETSIA